MRAVVTGATNGIGEAIARRLAGEGLTVTLVGRTNERLQAARERIDAAVPGADLVLERADLAELAQVRDLAGRLLAGPLPDAVVSNAALVTTLDRVTTDALPRVLAVNHLAPYLLLRTLAAALDRARLIVVGADPVSLARRPVDLDDLTFAHPERLGEPAELRPFFAYGRTKNMNAMFVYALARRLAGTGITVNGAHPGIIAGTGLSREVPGLGALVRQAFRSGQLPPPGPQPGVAVIGHFPNTLGAAAPGQMPWGYPQVQEAARRLRSPRGRGYPFGKKITRGPRSRRELAGSGASRLLERLGQGLQGGQGGAQRLFLLVGELVDALGDDGGALSLDSPVDFLTRRRGDDRGAAQVRGVGDPADQLQFLQPPDDARQHGRVQPFKIGELGQVDRPAEHHQPEHRGLRRRQPLTR